MRAGRSKSYEIDMCNGPLLPKILLFALPVMLSGILQLLFNAADMVVVGKFSGEQALAAVGATGSLSSLLVNLFIGLAVGVNVLVAKYYGAGKHAEMHDTVHTAVLTAIIAGAILTVIGLILAHPLLKWMGTPPDVIDQAVLYMRIYFLGMIGMLVYNFTAAVLRGVGDTRRPMYILMVAGVINVVLNLIFVIVFHWGVAGVAAATSISQMVSAVLTVLCLIKTDASYHLELKELRIEPQKLKEIAKIGVPASMQGMVFSLSNVLIQSSLNTFGSVAMAGSTAQSNIDSFVYISMNAVYQAALSFTSQNYGARQNKRVMKIMGTCLGMVFVVGVIMGWGIYLTGSKLLHIYTDNPTAIAYGVKKMAILCTTDFLCGRIAHQNG